MEENLTRLTRLLSGKDITLVGLGVSHTGLARLLADNGLKVTVCDKRGREQLGPACGELEEKGVRFFVGGDYPSELPGDVLFRTPGMYFGSPEIARFRAAGGIVTSEMELFCEFCPCPIIAVTGSDGKTTTSTLIAEMLRASGRTVFLGGNIGRALLPEIGAISPGDIAVTELSSFQLISMNCAPDVSVITNITPNHLDVHKSMREYKDAKRNIYLHQGAFSSTVLNLDNEITASFAGEVRGRPLLFSLTQQVNDGAYLREDGVLCRSRRGVATELIHADEIALPGVHNIANVLAAAAATAGFAPPEAAGRVARTFAGVEHRIEFVREISGARWYNDSIATSPARALAGLASFSGGVILIAGGADKNLNFEPLAPAICEKVKTLILTGETAGKIETALKLCPDYKEGSPEIIRAKDMARAVEAAFGAALPGDIVLLSPASTSFDFYANFEERGKHFKKLVEAINGQQ